MHPLDNLRNRAWRYLHSHKCNQSDLGRAIGVSQQSISKFLNAEATFGMSAAHCVALEKWLTVKKWNSGARIESAQKNGVPKKGKLNRIDYASLMTLRDPSDTLNIFES
jgi:transcriptional regulator with XRE-family HTH domain